MGLLCFCILIQGIYEKRSTLTGIMAWNSSVEFIWPKLKFLPTFVVLWHNSPSRT